MTIGAIQKLTPTAFPGHLSCSCFLFGCNWRCPWCNSADFVLPYKARKLEFIEEEAFFDFLKNKKPGLSGVILTGGEPTLHPGLPQFCQKIKHLGYGIKLETNGSLPQMLEKLIKNKLVDYLAMDIKAPKKGYGEAVGMEEYSFNYVLQNIEKSISLLKQNRVDYQFQTTVHPLLQKKDILDIVHWIKPAKKYCLRVFDNKQTLEPNFSVFEPCPKIKLFQIKQAIAPFFDTVQVV